jgi:putative FmdB family regulatory protein
MPIYEYECNQCCELFEKMISFSESDQLPACPKCESNDTRKKISKVVSFASFASFMSSNVGAAYASSNGCGNSGGFT